MKIDYVSELQNIKARHLKI